MKCGKGRNAGDDPNTLLMCDYCDTYGMMCLDCAGLPEVPQGQWFCSEECTRMARKRPRSGQDDDFILDGCSCFDGCDVIQYHARCIDCGIDACAACASTCHATHQKGSMSHGPFNCDCGAHGFCDERALIKAARFDQVVIANSQFIQVRALMHQHEAEHERLKAVAVAQQVEIDRLRSQFDEHTAIQEASTIREASLRSQLHQNSLHAQAVELCDAVGNIADETRVRMHALQVCQKTQQDLDAAHAHLALIQQQAATASNNAVSSRKTATELSEKANKLLQIVK